MTLPFNIILGILCLLHSFNGSNNINNYKSIKRFNCSQNLLYKNDDNYRFLMLQ